MVGSGVGRNLVRAAQGLFVLNSLIWVAIGVATVARPVGGGAEEVLGHECHEREDRAGDHQAGPIADQGLKPIGEARQGADHQDLGDGPQRSAPAERIDGHIQQRQEKTDAKRTIRPPGDGHQDPDHQ